MDPHWFILLVRGIGVMLLGFVVPSLITVLLDIAYSITLVEAPLTEYLISYFSSLVGHLVQFVFGLYLLFGGGRLTRWCLRSTFGSCPACGYDIRSIAAPVCPECGAPIAKSAERDQAGRP